MKPGITRWKIEPIKVKGFPVARPIPFSPGRSTHEVKMLIRNSDLLHGTLVRSTVPIQNVPSSDNKPINCFLILERPALNVHLMQVATENFIAWECHRYSTEPHTIPLPHLHCRKICHSNQSQSSSHMTFHKTDGKYDSWLNICFIGPVYRTETTHRLLCFKSKFPYHFAFTLEHFLFVECGC